MQLTTAGVATSHEDWPRVGDGSPIDPRGLIRQPARRRASLRHHVKTLHGLLAVPAERCNNSSLQIHQRWCENSEHDRGLSPEAG
jgi:hypothetical protein